MKKTVFITDASHNVGKRIVDYFVKNGFDVAVGFNGETSIGSSSEARYFLWNSQESGSIKKMVSKVFDTFGTVDIVINTLDYKVFGPLEFTEIELLEDMWRMNVEIPMIVYKEFIPHFKKRSKGFFLTLSSVSGVITHPFMASYNASKWALEGFCEGLNYELNPLGVKSRMVVTDYKNSGANERKTHFTLAQNEKSDYYQDYIKSRDIIFTHPSSSDSLDEVAKMVYRAATEYSDRIRFLVGEEIKEVMEIKKDKKGEDFLEYMKKRFKLKM